MSNIGCCTVQRILQLPKHNTDASNIRSPPRSINKAAEIIQLHCGTYLKDRKGKYKHHLAMAQRNASQESSSNTAYKREPTNSSTSAELSIVSEDINTPYPISILDEEKKDNNMQKKKGNKRNKMQRR